jgi:hypothetical protein
MENAMRLACYLMLPALKEKQAVQDDVKRHAQERGANRPGVAQRGEDECGGEAGSAGAAMAAGDTAPAPCHAQALAPVAPAAAGAPGGTQARGTQTGDTQASNTPTDTPTGTPSRAARGLCLRAYSPATQPRGSGRTHHAAALNPARRRRRTQAG